MLMLTRHQVRNLMNFTRMNICTHSLRNKLIKRTFSPTRDERKDNPFVYIILPRFYEAASSFAANVSTQASSCVHFFFQTYSLKRQPIQVSGIPPTNVGTKSRTFTISAIRHGATASVPRTN